MLYRRCREDGGEEMIEKLLGEALGPTPCGVAGLRKEHVMEHISGLAFHTCGKEHSFSDGLYLSITADKMRRRSVSVMMV